MPSSSALDLTGKVVVITGAGSGFGQAMSKAFCHAGAHVFGIGRRKEKLEETARLSGERFNPVAWDITRVDEAHKTIQSIVSRIGALHVLINNAGIMLDDEHTISTLPFKDWEATWQTNVSATFALSQAAFVHMREARFGRIANVTSGLGFRPMLEYGSYCVSKAAVNMLTRIFALEGESHNVLVNAIDPGVAKTEMNEWASESPETVNKVALHLATLPDNGPTGQCFNKQLKVLEW